MSSSKVPTSKVFVKPGPEVHWQNTSRLPVRLVLCFDGTGDTAEGSFDARTGTFSGTPDSIYTIYQLTKGGVVNDGNGRQYFQYVQYFEGVATINADSGGFLVQAQALFDGATGNGYLKILRNGYKVCCQQLGHDGDTRNPPHELFIYGFSRGAFIARALASFLQHVGLIKPQFLDQNDPKQTEFKAKFRTLLNQYMKVTQRSFFGFGKPLQASKDKPELLSFCIGCPRVRVLGAFDTVKTVIPLPIHNLLREKSPNIDFQMDAPGIVDHFRHALALNEARPLFNPGLWKEPSASDNSSYLEAWFFGYHHDIGGGDAVQGLALWPLQWILHTSTDNGLILDPTVQPYDILFRGTDNVVNTPHEIALRMFDMTTHHSLPKQIWGLKLNRPTSYMRPQPREYFQLVTKPPYLKFVKPKVFVHPSAYLIFDICSSFRIQVHEWKHFRRFVMDRFEALSKAAPPWWEKRTVENILQEVQIAKRLNLLVIGRPNTGKETMVRRIFGVPAGPTDKGIFNPVTIEGNRRIRIFYSNGFGNGGTDGKQEVASFFDYYRRRAQVNDTERVHAVWYFHDCSRSQIEDSEKAMLQMDFGNVPVLVILQNAFKVKDAVQEPEQKMPGSYNAEMVVTRQYTRAVEKIKKNLPLPPTGKFVDISDDRKAPRYLLTETASAYGEDALATAQIKAQRVEVIPKTALATEECVRAYTIWHKFTLTGARHPYDMYGSANLAEGLVECILGTFSMGFDGDTQLILDQVGAPWQALVGQQPNLYDRNLPGFLILLCTLDAVIVMTYAIRKRGTPKEEASPLKKEDLTAACTWYTTATTVDGGLSPQQRTHREVGSALQEEGVPRDACLANLQMKIHQVVEVSLTMGQDGDVTWENAKNYVTGYYTGVSGWVSGKLKGVLGT